MIPVRIKLAIDTWVLTGAFPGNFTKSILENNLVKAINGADEESLAAIKDIVQYVVNDIPAPCWGSKDNMNSWASAGGQKGKHDARIRHDALVLGD